MRTADALSTEKEVYIVSRRLNEEELVKVYSAVLGAAFDKRVGVTLGLR